MRRAAGGAEQKEGSNFVVVSMAQWPWWRLSRFQARAGVQAPSSSRAGLGQGGQECWAQGRHSPWDTPAQRGTETLGGQGGQRNQGFPGGRDGQDNIQTCSYRRLPSSCYSKTKCFTHLGSIIKYGSAGWPVVGANFFQFAEHLVTLWSPEKDLSEWLGPQRHLPLVNFSAAPLPRAYAWETCKCFPPKAPVLSCWRLNVNCKAPA